MTFTVEQFEELVRSAIDDIPEPFASALSEVPVIVRDHPRPEIGSAYGLYTGVPLDRRGGTVPFLPSTIEIYRHPLVDHFPDPDVLRAEVRVTVLHELGHHLGMDEDDLERLGYA